jgi:hypothetical protein
MDIAHDDWFWASNSAFGLWGLIFAFLTPKIIVFHGLCKFPDWWIYHMTILILGLKFRFWVLKAYFYLFDPLKYIFSSFKLNSWSMDTSHDHTNFGTQIPFLGSKGQFLPFGPLKVYIITVLTPFLGSEDLFSPFWSYEVYIFFIYIKFLIDWWVT